MSKKKYVIDDRKPSMLPKIGSAVIAIGSLASVAAVASPNLIPLMETSPASSGDLTADPDPQTGQTIASPTLPTTQVLDSAGNPVTVQAQYVSADAMQIGAEANPSATSQPVAGEIQSGTELVLPGLPTVGNASSPTPYSSGSQANASYGTASGAAGNISSPTPGGSYADEDDDDREDDNSRYEDDDDDDDDDRDDDEDDD